MTTLCIFLAGSVCGALCMWASNRRALMAAREERTRSDRRVDKIASERDTWKDAAEQATIQLTQLQLDQANSAGYTDGYNACRHEFDIQNSAESANSVIDQALQDGNKVAFAIFRH